MSGLRACFKCSPLKWEYTQKNDYIQGVVVVVIKIVTNILYITSIVNIKNK